MHNCIASFWIGGDFLKSYWAKWPHKQVAFFHGRTVKTAESNIFTCKQRSIFKTLSRILSYTNHERGKFQSFHVQTGWKKQLTVRANLDPSAYADCWRKLWETLRQRSQNLANWAPQRMLFYPTKTFCFFHIYFVAKALCCFRIRTA